MFAGIGGFRSGMEQAGHKCVGWIEWDKFARQSYQAMYDTEGEYNAKDIRQVQGSALPDSDVWCFGFPCQDVSSAGKQAGLLNGKRSGLFFEVVRLLQERARNKETLPKTLFIENVKNLLSIDGGWGFARMQIELDQAGYDIEWSVINSAQVVPQNRERVYVVGHLRGQRTQKVFPIIRENETINQKQSIQVVGNVSKTGHHSDDVMSEDGISKTIIAQNAYKHTPKVAIHQVGNILKTKSFGGNPQVGRVYATDGLAPTLNTMQGGGRQPKIIVKRPLKGKTRNGWHFEQECYSPDSITGALKAGGGSGNIPKIVKSRINSQAENYVIRKLTPKECWHLQGFTDEQFDKAKAAGVSDSQLYKQAGNSVTVPVIKAIAERLRGTILNVSD